MGRTWTTEVGHTTRALAPGDVDAGITAALRAGGNIVELSAFHEKNLDSAMAGARGAARRNFRRVSVHAPARGRQLFEADLVARLAGLGLPVVAHPEVIATPGLWRPLGARLLIENNDGRKPAGRTPGELAEVFAALPEAGFCLDVSHALDAGGAGLLWALTSTFRGRLEQLHAGCGGGVPRTERLEPELLRVISAVIAQAGRPLPVIIERPATTASGALAQVYAVRGAVVAGVSAPAA